MLALIARPTSADDDAVLVEEQIAGQDAAPEGMDAFAVIRDEPGNVSVGV
jgi:hypothetical protein